jgi:hypothetical protein
MVEPPETARVSAELVARGTDASPLEAVLEPVPEDGAPVVEAEASRPSQQEASADEAARHEEMSSPEATASCNGPAPCEGAAPCDPPASHGEAAPPDEVAPPDEAASLAEPPAPAPASNLESFYDVLGVSPKASRDQIEKAHRFCLDMYKEGALATYSLLEVGDAETARRRISLAYETLVDAVRRREYDLSLGLTPASTPVVPFSMPRSGECEGAPSAAPAVPAGPLRGADLRRIRESRGVALREIAHSTKIGLRFLEYLEEDRHAMLPPAVYLRGFLQEYARALGMDPRRTADAYMSRLPGRD